MFLRFAELFVVLVLGLIMVTQIIVPLARGTKLFPILRLRKPVDHLSTINSEIERERVLIEAAERERQLRDLHAKRLAIEQDAGASQSVKEEKV